MSMFAKKQKQEEVKEPTPPATPGTAVAPAAKNAVSNLNFGALAGQSNVGMEDADRDSFALPFLVILQKMSPQLDRNHAEYIADAREGDILNTATRQVYGGDEGILAANVAFKRSFTKWKLREKGGGYLGEHAPSDPIVMTTKPDAKNRNVLPDGEAQLVDTRMHGVLLFADDNAQPALVTMASTQIKKSKRWMTDMQERQKGDNLPTFAHTYRLSTVPEKNDQGSWYGWKVEYVGPVTEQEHIDAAMAFYTALRAGQRTMKADPGSAQPE